LAEVMLVVCPFPDQKQPNNTPIRSPCRRWRDSVLKSALGQYSSGNREQVGIDEADAVRVLVEKYEIVRAMFRPDTKGGFDYRPALDAAATPQARLAIMAGAIEWILTLQQAEAAEETSEEGKKRARRRYADAVAALSIRPNLSHGCGPCNP
jgi:hypothetical protein